MCVHRYLMGKPRRGGAGSHRFLSGGQGLCSPLGPQVLGSVEDGCMAIPGMALYPRACCSLGMKGRLRSPGSLTHGCGVTLSQHPRAECHLERLQGLVSGPVTALCWAMLWSLAWCPSMCPLGKAVLVWNSTTAVPSESWAVILALFLVS